jgi:hypothetical protein
MNDVSNLPMAHESVGDGIALVADPPTASLRAKYLSFKKGKWLFNYDNDEPVPIGTTFVLHGAKQGWVRLAKGEPVQRISREAGQHFPARAELGDTDQSKWAKFDGKLSDPWSLSNELLLSAEDTGHSVVFSTLSWSGREAVEDLCRLVVYQRRQRGDSAKPIIAIGTASRKSPHGPYDVPSFTITRWVGAEEAPAAPSQLSADLSAHLGAASTIPGNATTTGPLPQPRRRKQSADSAPPVADVLDDSIP